jgi:phosphonate degradation associated HDIG domain protein
MMSQFDRQQINASNIIDYIEDIFIHRGSESYLGEKVSVAQHMLQTAQGAEQAGASDSMIVAALLHDIGHYANDLQMSSLDQGQDNLHQQAGANLLAPYFPAAVVEPIRQHVMAKRYLCTVQTSYLVRLSDASTANLKLQGGLMKPEEVDAFEQQTHFHACVDLRIWDEEAKDPTKEHPAFDYYRPLLEALLAEHADISTQGSTIN